jgi:hypothetical protein
VFHSLRSNPLRPEWHAQACPDKQEAPKQSFTGRRTSRQWFSGDRITGLSAGPNTARFHCNGEQRCGIERPGSPSSTSGATHKAGPAISAYNCAPPHDHGCVTRLGQLLP